VAFEFAGRSFVMDTAGGADLIATTMQAGGYEAPLPLILLTMVAHTPGLFLDVGANNGLYALLAAKARPDSRVVAFEPFPPALDVLRRNLALNGVESRVTVRETALSDQAGPAVLYLPDPGHQLLETSASLEATFRTRAATLEVRRERADDIDFGGPVSVIKADIEGHEPAFLRGAIELLRRDRPIVFAEMLSQPATVFEACTTFMSGLDYLLFRLRPDCIISAEAIRHDPLGWNWGLIPREREGFFRECCGWHGLEMLRPG
jgi:FkbM family methyltransferase